MGYLPWKKPWKSGEYLITVLWPMKCFKSCPRLWNTHEKAIRYYNWVKLGFSWIFHDTENPMILNTRFFMGWISWSINGLENSWAIKTLQWIVKIFIDHEISLQLSWPFPWHLNGSWKLIPHHLHGGKWNNTKSFN